MLVEKKSTNLNEKRYHFLIDNILDVVGELDLNGIFTYVNPYIYDELGYQPDEIIGREIYEFVHPDDAKKITKVLFRRPKSHDFITEIRLKNDKNQFIWYEIKARRLKDYNNQRKILITLKNISKVKVLEEKLEKKDENYQKITNSFPEIQFWKVFTPSKYERAIRTTSEMLKVIIENIPQCVFWKDTNFKYLGCNGNYSEFIGIEHPESIIGKTDEDFLSNREKIQQIRESETSVMLSGKPLYHTNESWIIEKGNDIWLDINRVPLIETKGDVNGILVTFEEITDRKIAEEKLRNSEKKYKNLSIELETIIDIIPSMIFVKNKSGIYTRVNQVFADYLKLEKEDIIGKSTFELFPQEVAANLKRDDLEVIKNGLPKLNIEKTVEFPVGEVSGIISKMPYYNEKDEINGVIGFAIDISERKELEQRLIKSEERYRELANSLPQVICETDERGNLTFVNKNAYNVFGYTPDDFNKGLNVLQMLIPEDRKRAMENIKKVLRGKKEEKMGDNEYTALRKDSSTFPVIIYSSPIIYKDSSVGMRSIIIDITEKMKAEQRLKESEERYRSLVEDSQEGIWALDINENTIFINPRMCEMLGYTKNEMMGKNLHLLIPDSMEERIKGNRIRREKGIKETYDLELLKKDGTIIYTNIKAAPIISESREYKGSFAYITDITTQKHAEDILRESEEKYRTLFESCMDAVVFTGLDGSIIDCNQAYSDMLGYTLEELKELTFHQLTPEKWHEMEAEILKKQFIERGYSDEYEKEYIRKDGTIFPISLRGWAIYDENGKVINLWGFVRDITERKKAEQKVKESEEKYKSLFEQTPMAILLINFEGVIEDCNTSTEVLFGYTKEELLGINYLKFDIFPLDTKLMLAKSFSKFLKTGVPEPSEIILYRKDGKKVWINSYPINVKIAENSYILAVIQDITERKKKEEEIRLQSEIIENMSEGVYLIKLDDGTIVYTNPAFEEMFGYNPGEMIGKDVAIVNAPTDKTPEETKNEIVGILKNTGEWHGEVLNIKKDGTPFWCYANVSLFDHPEHGSVIVSVHTDITDRKKAENEIKNLAKFPSENPNPVLRVTKEKVIYTNKEGEKIFHTKEGSEAPAVLQESLVKALDTNSTIVIEVDLNNRHYSIDITPISEEGYANVYGRDITDEKEAEITIRESEKKLKDLIEAIPIGITISNPVGEIFEVNSHAINILGYDSKEEYLNTPAINFYANPADRVQYTQLLKSGPVKDFEVKFKRKDGKIFWGSLTSIAKTIGDDVIYFNTVQDISHRKSMEKIFTDLAKFPAENPNPVLRVTKEFVLYVNQAGNNLFQVEVGDKIPLTLENYVRTAFNEKKNVNPEIQLNSHIFSIFITPIEGTEYVNVYGMNITDRTIAEQKLKESEEISRKQNVFLNNVLEALTHPFYVINVKDYKVVLANSTASSEDLEEEQYCYNLIHHNDKPCEAPCMCPLNEVKNTKKSYIVEHLHPDKEGHEKIYDVYGYPILDENGNVVQMIEYTLDITDRVITRRELKESEEKYRTVINNIPGMVYRGNPDWTINLISKSELISGYSREDFISRKINWVDVIHPNDREAVVNEGSLMREKPMSIEQIYRIITKKGVIRWVNDRKMSFFDDNGVLGGIDGIIYDITNLKEIEQNLKESQKKYKLLSEELELILDHIVGPVFYKDTENRFIWVNRYIADIYKMKREDLIGKSLFEFYPKEVAQTYWDDDLEVINSGKPKLNKEESWETADGLKWVLTSKIPYIDEKGDIKGIIGTSVDITERKIAEQKLIESEAKHRGLLETAVMGLIEIDLLLNKISYVNPKLLEIVGYTREELKDDSIFYKLIHLEDLEEVLKSHGDRDVEFRIYSKEGKLKWLSGTRKYIIAENGELVNVRLWLQDITESKEIEKIKSSLLTRFSHEFKTPLISIKGFADFLLMEYKVNLDEKILSFLRRIKSGSNRLEVLINSFIESSQLEKAEIRVNLRQEEVSDLIQEVVHELEGYIGMREHTINVSLDEKLITTIDKEKIYTVLSNILINAIDYTPQGGKISIKSSIDKNYLTISVKDNGIGLTEEEKKCLFKPFGKIERYGKGWDITVGGMGMGLYISKEIIELHGGKIWAESEGRSKGSEFHFSLPIK